jgi:hypothetical protein
MRQSSRGAALKGWLVAIAFSGCGCKGAPPSDLRERFEGAGVPAVDVRVIVQDEHRASSERYLKAAVASFRMLAPLLGAFPHSSLTVVDSPWRHEPPAAKNVVVLERTPWWSSATSMVPELAPARAVARRYWLDVIDPGALPAWFVDGFVEYAARRIVAPIFQGTNLGPGYAMLEQRYFGGFVPRFVRIRLLPESVDGDGGPLPADVTSAGTAADRRRLAARTVLAFNTLERWLSTPVLDGAIAEFARVSRRDRPTLASFMHTLSAASGQDLSWLMAQVFGGTAAFDYAVTALSSTASDGGGFETRVTVARLGAGFFTGAAAPRVGPFESGRGLAVSVEFVDGERMVEHWDGREATKAFVYRSRARAVSATIDPERTLVLDVNRTNNSRTLEPKSGIAATRWAGRWMLWLEDALLTYTILL